MNDNKNSNTQRNEMPSSAITNEEFQRRPLRDCRQQLETGKTSHKNQSNNLESPSKELNVAKCPKDNVNVSSKVKYLIMLDLYRLGFFLLINIISFYYFFEYVISTITSLLYCDRYSRFVFVTNLYLYTD